jgi:hypothetical protein
MTATQPHLTKSGAVFKRDTIRAYKESHGFTTTWDPTKCVWTASNGHVKAEGVGEVQAIRKLASAVGCVCEL